LIIQQPRGADAQCIGNCFKLNVRHLAHATFDLGYAGPVDPEASQLEASCQVCLG